MSRWSWCLAVLVVVGVRIAAAGPLDPVLSPYLRIQTQLATDATGSVAADAREVATAAASLGDAGAPIVSAASELAATTSLESARDAFGKLSSALLSYVSSTKTPLSDGVVRMYCPMVRKRWLQQGGDVRNPYFGKSMLTCGVTEKS